MKKFYFNKIGLIILISCIYFAKVSHASYLVSIPPLHSLLTGILKDIEGVQVDTLLDGQISPHTFTLKPSHIHKIRQAKVIFWIGSLYETFMVKPLDTFDATHVQMVNIPGLTLWPLRQDGNWQHGCNHHNHASHPVVDAHIWLNVQNALKITKYFYDYFIKVYPDQQAILENNMVRMTGILKQLDQQLTIELQDYKKQAFLVYHDGYQYFEKAYNLAGVGVVMSHPERAPSVHYVKNLINDARFKHVRCVFSESQFNSRFIDELVRTLHARTAALDPFGYNKYHDERDYVAMMQAITYNFVKCFK